MADPPGQPGWALAVVTAARTALNAPARALRARCNTGARVARRPA